MSTKMDNIDELKKPQNTTVSASIKENDKITTKAIIESDENTTKATEKESERNKDNCENTKVATKNELNKDDDNEMLIESESKKDGSSNERLSTTLICKMNDDDCDELKESNSNGINEEDHIEQPIQPIKEDLKNISNTSNAETAVNDSKDETFGSDKQGSSVSDTPGGRVRRDRKKVERFVQVVKKSDEAEIVVVGKGTALRDIPFIEKMISKYGPEELKVLHRIAFNRPGAILEVKRNLRKFKGFGFTEGLVYDRKKATIEKIVSPELKKILTILGLEKKGLKQELAEKVFNFLLSPVDHGKQWPKSKSKKKKGTKRKRKTEKKTESGKGKKKQTKEEVTDKIESSSSEDDKESSESESESEEEEKPQPPKIKSPPPKKRAAPKKSVAKRVTSESSNADDEPLSKKFKKAPSESEIKSFIKTVLDKADLEQVTMKKLCQQVYDHYPSHDLSHKKDFIKSTVKSILS